MASTSKSAAKRSGRVKSYGKEREGTRSRKQDNTLTQMDFVKFYDDNDDIDSTGDIYEGVVEKPRKRRRRTTGEEPSSSKYHTQTITQLDWSFASAPEDDLSIYDGPVSSSPAAKKIRPTRSSRKSASNPKSKRKSPPPSKDRLQTPVRRIGIEISSSQSPATPPSVQSRASATRRSPLKEYSTNIPIPFKPALKATSTPYKPARLKVEDTYETSTTETSHGEPPTPSKQISPPKSVRFAIPPIPSRTSDLQASPIPRRLDLLKTEISDSDADSDDELDSEDTTGGIRINSEEPVEYEVSQETYGGGTCFETRNEGDQDVVTTDLSQLNEELSAEEVIQHKNLHGQSQLESQRLSTQHVNSMAQRTRESDIFISLPPQHVTEILDRTRDHEFRVYLLPPAASRIWIYETKPVQKLKYMAVISQAKRPGEIKDERGKGNESFNAKPAERSEFAYKILELYELADPLPLSKLIARQWFKTAPQMYAPVRPAVLDELMANLKPPLFVKSATPHSSPTDTQEVEAQMLNDMIQFTQARPEADSESFYESPTLPRLPLPSSNLHNAAHSQSQSSPSKLPRPSQASTVDLTQASPSPVLGIIPESPIRPLRTPKGKDYTGRSDSSLPVPLLIPSSQFLTKSQMLPESLMNESVAGPVGWVDDSQDEGDDED